MARAPGAACGGARARWSGWSWSLFFVVAIFAPLDRALRSDRDELVARCASRRRRRTGSAPTRSAATCCRA